MPAVTANGEEGNDVDQTEDKMWTALKRHIIRERQRKKEEHEAEVEEERLRKEREARERQDVMTLGETREQITQLESKLSQLKEEKHQLFLQLKKLLNEDDNRKRQQFKESSDVGPMKIAISNIQVPMFMPPTSSSGEGQQSRGPSMSAHILNKPGMTGPSNLKRGRSPSPTYVGGPPPHSMSPYSQHGSHGGRGHSSSMQGGPSPANQMHPSHQQSQHPQLGKHSNVYGNQGHKIEDGRMGREIARAVLWNKPPQYNSPPVNAPYYTHMTSTSVPPPSSGGERAPSMLYPPPHAPSHAPPHAPPHAPSLMYAPPPTQQAAMAYHVEVKHARDASGMGQQMDGKKDGQPQVLIGLSDGHHSQGGGVGSGYGGNAGQQQNVNRVSIHAAQIAMHNNVQGSKPGSITSGYPVRQQNANVQNSNIYPNRHRY